MKQARSVGERLAKLAAGVLLSTLLATSGEAAVTAPTSLARWRPYDIIVDLHNLPKSYTCDQLYYKFWEVLWTLGARSNMKILTYDCAQGLAGHARSAPARSPRVELKFALAAALPSTEARWADLMASRRTVRLEPGQPRALDSSDCALLEQIKDTLLPALPADVVGARLDCTVPARSAHFSVSIRTLTPEARGTVRSASARDTASPGA
jgi:hypothetical protein